MSNVLAGIGRGQLRVLDQRVSQRRAVFETYREALADLPQVQLDAGAAGLSLHPLAQLLHPAGQPMPAAGATTCCARLERHSIEARPVWKPMHLQPLFRGAPYFAHDEGERRVGRPVRGRHLPALGVQPDRDEQLARVIDHLRRALALAEDAACGCLGTRCRMLVVDLALGFAAWWAAFWLRFNFDIPAEFAAAGADGQSAGACAGWRRA